MIQELTSFPGLTVYTIKGMYAGRVDNVVLDLENSKISGLTMTEVNEALVAGANKVIIPYRWVSSVGDVIILRYFPENVSLNEREKSEEEPE